MTAENSPAIFLIALRFPENLHLNISINFMCFPLGLLRLVLELPFHSRLNKGTGRYKQSRLRTEGHVKNHSQKRAMGYRMNML